VWRFFVVTDVWKCPGTVSTPFTDVPNPRYLAADTYRARQAYGRTAHAMWDDVADMRAVNEDISTDRLYCATAQGICILHKRFQPRVTAFIGADLQSNFEIEPREGALVMCDKKLHRLSIVTQKSKTVPLSLSLSLSTLFALPFHQPLFCSDRRTFSVRDCRSTFSFFLFLQIFVAFR
jgi:hypothetical protein